MWLEGAALIDVDNIHEQKLLNLSWSLLLAAVTPSSLAMAGILGSSYLIKESWAASWEHTLSIAQWFQSKFKWLPLCLSAFLGFRLQLQQGREQCHVRHMHKMRHELKPQHSGDNIGIAPLLILHQFPFTYWFLLLYTDQHMIISHTRTLTYIYIILLENMLWHCFVVAVLNNTWALINPFATRKLHNKV